MFKIKAPGWLARILVAAGAKKAEPKSEPAPLDLTEYADQWVAIKEGKVIGHNRSIGALVDEIEASGVKRCMIYFCREDGYKL